MSDDHDEIISLRQRMHDLANTVQAGTLRNAAIVQDVQHLVQMVTEHREEAKAFMSATGVTLGMIKEQVTRTNGRVNGHDDHLTVNDREIRDIKETLAKVMWMALGLNVSVLAGVIVYWVTR